MPLGKMLLDDVRRFLSEESKMASESIKNAGKYSSSEMNDLEKQTFDAIRELGRTPVRIHAKPSNLREIFNDPDARLKNQFELGKGKTNGSDDLDLRAIAEKKALGITDKVDYKNRPKYGVGGSKKNDKVADETYGRSQIILDPDKVKSRTTFTRGDTVDNEDEISAVSAIAPGMNWYGPSDFWDAQSWARPPEEIRKVIEGSLNSLKNGETNVINNWGGLQFPDYIEAQVHGEIPFTDIKSVRVVGSHDPNRTEERMKMMKNASDKFGFSIENYNPTKNKWECVYNCKE